MFYGSEGFESVEGNNHNIVLFADTNKTAKLALGKDVALLLPSDPEKVNFWSGYPTHQESWLPIWFILLNHPQHKTPEELNYRKK